MNWCEINTHYISLSDALGRVEAQNELIQLSLIGAALKICSHELLIKIGIKVAGFIVTNEKTENIYVLVKSSRKDYVEYTETDYISFILGHNTLGVNYRPMEMKKLYYGPVVVQLYYYCMTDRLGVANLELYCIILMCMCCEFNLYTHDRLTRPDDLNHIYIHIYIYIVIYLEPENNRPVVVYRNHKGIDSLLSGEPVIDSECVYLKLQHGNNIR